MILKPGQVGFKWPDEIKAKIKASSQKRIWSDEAQAKRIAASVKVCNKKVICLSNGNEFESESDAARFYRLKPSQISRVCRGERHTVHKMIFRFKEDNNG